MGKTDFISYKIVGKIITDYLTNSVTNSVEQDPTWSSASQEIPRILWNPKFHYHIHTRPPLSLP